jgi:hypothetical protein
MVTKEREAYSGCFGIVSKDWIHFKWSVEKQKGRNSNEMPELINCQSWKYSGHLAGYQVFNAECL